MKKLSRATIELFVLKLCRCVILGMLILMVAFMILTSKIHAEMVYLCIYCIVLLIMENSIIKKSRTSSSGYLK